MNSRWAIDTEMVLVAHFLFAVVAQLAERLICNQRVEGSKPFGGSILLNENGSRGPKSRDIRMVRITAIAAVQKTEMLNGIWGFESSTIRQYPKLTAYRVNHPVEKMPVPVSRGQAVRQASRRFSVKCCFTRAAIAETEYTEDCRNG